MEPSLAYLFYFSHGAPVYLFAMVFGAVAVLCSFLIGRVYNTTPTIMLVLGGVIVSSVFSSLISLMKYLADPADQLPAIVFWLMGSLASANYHDIFVAGVPILVMVMLIRWPINVLLMGYREAQTLGIKPSLAKGLG